MRCAFTAFFCRYAKSMSLTQIASIAKVLLALTRLLLQAPSENLWILSSGTERRLLRQSSRVFLHATIMLLLSHTRRPGLIRRKPRLARCIFHCGKWPFLSHFAMCMTCFCTVRLCYRDAILTCFATGVKLLVSENTTSIGRRSVAGGAPEHHAFSQYFKDDTCHEGHGYGKASTASHLFRLFSK